MSSLLSQYRKITRTDDNMDFRTALALGRVPGAEIELMIGTSFQQDINMGNKTIWDLDTPLTRLTVDTPLFVSSTDSADTNFTVLVVTLNELFERQVTIATTHPTDAQLQQALNVSGIIMTAAIVVGPGTPAGDLYFATAGATTGGVPNDATTIQSRIRTPFNLTHNGFIMIPKGKIGVIYKIRTISQDFNSETRFEQYVSIPGFQTVMSSKYSSVVPGSEFDFQPPLAATNLAGQQQPSFPEGTFVEVRALVEQNNTDVFVGFDVALFEIDMFGLYQGAP